VLVGDDTRLFENWFFLVHRVFCWR
jgi:hypothetical protein